MVVIVNLGLVDALPDVTFAIYQGLGLAQEVYWPGCLKGWFESVIMISQIKTTNIMDSLFFTLNLHTHLYHCLNKQLQNVYNK